MKYFFASISLVGLSASVGACGGQTIGNLDGGTESGTDSGGTGTCSANAPCPNGSECGFAESQGCAAKTGQCFPVGAVCNTFQPGCSCDNQTINIACTGLPNGYSTAPLAYTGSCGTTTLDAGGPPSYACGLTTCVVGQDLCYVPANDPNGGTCMPLGNCTDCACAQSHFQCVSTCKQSGPEIYIDCQ